MLLHFGIGLRKETFLLNMCVSAFRFLTKQAAAVINTFLKSYYVPVCVKFGSCLTTTSSLDSFN